MTDTIDTLRAQLDKLTAENEQMREQRNRIGLYIDRALNGGKKDDHEAGLGGRMDAIRALRAQLAEAQAALKTVMRNAELSKEPCGPDPESPAATRNAKFASLASVAAQGLGMVRGPSLTEHLVEAQKDAARYSWLRMNRLWLKANLPTIAAPDFDATIDAAIDAAKGKTS